MKPGYPAIPGDAGAPHPQGGVGAQPIGGLATT
jgi:hypothetical protein